MKKILIVLAMLLVAPVAHLFSQSTSFSLLKNNYEDAENVHTFALDGFICKAIFSLAQEDDEFRDAVKSIRRFELITIPIHTFAAGSHTREGFRKLLKKDNFESLAKAKDHGDHAELFVQTNGNRRDRYLVWTESDTEVTAIELEGQIDVAKLMKQSKRLADAGNQANEK